MKNDAYWANRMRILEDALLDTGYEYVQNLERQYDKAIRDIETDIAHWYQRFAKNNEISLNDARKLLNSQELEEFKWTVEEYIKYGKENAINGAWIKQLENASARVHISRLEAIKLQLQQQAEALAAKQAEAVKSVLGGVYKSSYYHTAFELQKGVGVGWTLHAIDENVIEKVLSRPWTLDKQTFSDRIWANKQALVNTVNTQITQMIMRGAAPDNTIKAIADRFKVSKSQAGRLVMTESAAFTNEARKDCFKDLDVEKYIIVETLDGKTCGLCAQLDGKVYPMSEYAIGVTAPPFHPWCRGTTAPYFDDMDDIAERWARDPETGKTYTVPGNMTYKQWAAKQEAIYGEGIIEKSRQLSYNVNADKKQWKVYKERLGNEAPRSFSEFQELKYGDVVEYGELKGLFSYKGRVPEATKADYEAYKAVKATGVIGTVRVPPEIIDTDILIFNDAHAERHGCSLENAKDFVKSAKCTVRRKRWDGVSINYYSLGGATYINADTMKIKTAFSEKDFDPTTKAIVEVFK